MESEGDEVSGNPLERGEVNPSSLKSEIPGPDLDFK
jgi:hypothetical protein